MQNGTFIILQMKSMLSTLMDRLTQRPLHSSYNICTHHVIRLSHVPQQLEALRHARLVPGLNIPLPLYQLGGNKVSMDVGLWAGRSYRVSVNTRNSRVALRVSGVPGWMEYFWQIKYLIMNLEKCTRKSPWI